MLQFGLVLFLRGYQEPDEKFNDWTSSTDETFDLGRTVRSMYEVAKIQRIIRKGSEMIAWYDAYVDGARQCE